MILHAATLQVGPYIIGGVSTGGVETSIRVQELGICFDMGRCLPRNLRMSHILITHGHPDHVGGVINYLSRRQLYGMAPPTLYIEDKNAAALRDAIEAFGRLQNNPLPHTLVEVRPEEEIEYKNGLFFKTFRSKHVVPTLGYTVSSRKDKLLPAFLDLPGSEIARLRQEGKTNLFKEVEEALVTYPGDCLIETVEQNECVRKSRILVLETTFLDERKGVDIARLGGHIHLDEVCERADLFENEHIVLMHFSQLHRPDEVCKILKNRLPKALLERVHILTGDVHTEGEST